MMIIEFMFIVVTTINNVRDGDMGYELDVNLIANVLTLDSLMSQDRHFVCKLQVANKKPEKGDNKQKARV